MVNAPALLDALRALLPLAREHAGVLANEAHSNTANKEIAQRWTLAVATADAAIEAGSPRVPRRLRRTGKHRT
jgi:hypothetical protein